MKLQIADHGAQLGQVLVVLLGHDRRSPLVGLGHHLGPLPEVELDPALLVPADSLELLPARHEVGRDGEARCRV